MSPRAIVAKGVQALTHDSTVSIAIVIVMLGFAYVAGRFSHNIDSLVSNGEEDRARIAAVEKLGHETAQTLASVAATVNEISKRLDRERSGS